MKTFKPKILASAGLCLALASGSALAQTAQATDPDPYMMDDGSWVSLYGTVANAGDDGFDLNYGDGIVRVEMDDFDAWPEAYVLSDGLDVAVVGKIDDDLFELTSIEASTVYIDGLNTVFSASELDEENLSDAAFYQLPELSNVVLEGKVRNVNVREGKFELKTGGASYDVSVESLGYNPLDEIGYQKISADDRVRVIIALDAETLERGEFEATRLVTLQSS